MSRTDARPFRSAARSTVKMGKSVSLVRRRLYAANWRGKLAATATVLGSPPGNHLEALRGERKGRHSNRINEQWRICFV